MSCADTVTSVESDHSVILNDDMTLNDFSRSAFPPQGWIFRQPQTNWTNPMAMVGFKASVDAIRQHRLANPAITSKNALSTDPEEIGNELEKYTRQRLGIPQVAPTFFSQASSRLPARVVAAAAHVRRAAQGTAVVVDWIQAGGDPVAQDLAEKRAEVCVACPKNVAGAWYTEAPATLIKEAIKGWQTLKGSSFAFETRQGDRLKSCDVCKCLMRLKVFCPLDHILAKTKPEIMRELPPNCWIVTKDL